MKLKQFKSLNKGKGRHFFEPATMRFFNSKIETDILDDDGHFITSEQFDSHFPRLFSLRQANFKDGSVKTIGDFQQFETKEQAIAFLK